MRTATGKRMMTERVISGMATRVVCPANCRQTGNYPETGFWEIRFMISSKPTYGPRDPSAVHSRISLAES